MVAREAPSSVRNAGMMGYRISLPMSVKKLTKPVARTTGCRPAGRGAVEGGVLVASCLLCGEESRGRVGSTLDN